MAINPTPRQLSLLKSLIFLLALIPFARMVWLTYTGQLVEPLEFITRGTGDWTLYFLCSVERRAGGGAGGDADGAGEQKDQGSFHGGSPWWVEKRAITNAIIYWRVTSNPSAN